MLRNWSKILVMRSGALGDFVLTLPAINALRHHFSQAQLCLIGRPAYLQLARPTAVINQDSAALAPLYTPGPLPATTRNLFGAADFILAYAVDADGVLAAHLDELATDSLVWDPRPNPDAEQHIVDYLLTPLEGLGLAAAEATPHVYLEKKDRAYAANLWQEHDFPGKLIALHPGSGGTHKCWPLAKYLDLAHALKQRHLHVVFLCGPADEALTEQLAHKSYPLICPPTPLDLAGVLERVALLVGNDSGPGHLAAALNVPVIALFGPTDPRIWQPRGPCTGIIRAPDGQFASLSVDSVLEKCLSTLDLQSALSG